MDDDAGKFFSNFGLTLKFRRKNARRPLADLCTHYAPTERITRNHAAQARNQQKDRVGRGEGVRLWRGDVEHGEKEETN